MERYSSGSPWEPIVGYSRAVRVGKVIEVAGTVATGEDGKPVAPGDPAAQTRQILRRIIAAIMAAGGSAESVVRTRMFVTDISRWEEIGRVHGEFFGAVRPVTTMVEVRSLIDPAYMVEIEATAVLE